MGDTFENAWKVVKMVRTLEEVRRYEAGRCPQCDGEGTIPISYATRGEDEKRKDFGMSMTRCPTCGGSGKPDEEMWGDDGLVEALPEDDEDYGVID
tara:strand:- start:7562 stop:7849 length:288 start_codon:yes stop_codon:yes gene_type:complete